MMRLLCALGGHEADEQVTYNSGYYFSSCRRCGTHMVRSGGSWEDVPDGHKVVWKSGRHAHSLEPDYSPVLPVVHRAGDGGTERMSIVPRRTRVLVPVRVEAARRTNEAATPAAERTDYPVWLAVAAILGAGLQLALGLRDFRGGL